MRIHLLSVGTRMPKWAELGFQEYAKRMPPENPLVLKEVASPARARTASVAERMSMEGERLLAALPKTPLVIALDVGGELWSTQQLAAQLSAWLRGGRDVALLVGGPDGLDKICLDRAERRWSLSPLTLPHMVVRVVVAEQLYRASTLLRNHPYHRG
ncbi:MAG: 50S rRNA methyltransferase [Gammaproteobacteria bacterium SG8_47]|nr:MAG: 50S rRNA methyltransferase [Gammaproteobacteria bacterium SG8_47]